MTPQTDQLMLQKLGGIVFLTNDESFTSRVTQLWLYGLQQGGSVDNMLFEEDSYLIPIEAPKESKTSEDKPRSKALTYAFVTILGLVGTIATLTFTTAFFGTKCQKNG